MWSHKARITLVIAAMRHFRDQLRKQGLPLVYHPLHETDDNSLSGSLEKDLQRLRPGEIVMTEAGD